MTLFRLSGLRAIAPILMLPVLSSCASQPEVVTVTEQVEVVRERLVPVDSSLTYSQSWPEIEVQTWRDIAVLSIHYRDRWQSCSTRMAEIRKLGAESDSQ